MGLGKLIKERKRLCMFEYSVISLDVVFEEGRAMLLKLLTHFFLSLCQSFDYHDKVTNIINYLISQYPTPVPFP